MPPAAVGPWSSSSRCHTVWLLRLSPCSAGATRLVSQAHHFLTASRRAACSAAWACQRRRLQQQGRSCSKLARVGQHRKLFRSGHLARSAPAHSIAAAILDAWTSRCLAAAFVADVQGPHLGKVLTPLFCRCISNKQGRAPHTSACGKTSVSIGCCCSSHRTWQQQGALRLAPLPGA